MKGTSPSRASGEAFTASRSDVTMEIPINITNQSRGEAMDKITTVAARNASTDVVVTIGIDLAKNVFARHGTAAGKPVLLRPELSRMGLIAPTYVTLRCFRVIKVLALANRSSPISSTYRVVTKKSYCTLYLGRSRSIRNSASSG